jgi:hypothetical protein
MRILKSEEDYKQAVADAEGQYGADSILTGGALVDLAQFYEIADYWTPLMHVMFAFAEYWKNTCWFSPKELKVED